MTSEHSQFTVDAARLPTLGEIRAMQDMLGNYIRPTPLIQLDTGLSDRRIFLKLETQPPIGAFKIRPALGAILLRDPSDLARGVATVSSGNLAYGLAWAAQALKIPMVAYMTRDAPQSKIDGVRHLGGEIRFVSQEQWWRFITQETTPDQPEVFINPVADPGVLAGNGSIGMELMDQLPELSSIWAPFGGGSLITGIAAGLRVRGSEADIFAVESDHAAPATAALTTGEICEVPVRPSFIRSMGGPTVVPQLWPLTREILSGTAVLTESEIAAAVRVLFYDAKVVAEGAGAAALAAVLRDKRATGDVVCIISGGNIDLVDYLEVLQGNIPHV